MDSLTFVDDLSGGGFALAFSPNSNYLYHSTFQKSPKRKTSKATNEMSPTDDLSTGSSRDCSRTSSITELDSVHQEEPNHVSYFHWTEFLHRLVAKSKTKF